VEHSDTSKISGQDEAAFTTLFQNFFPTLRDFLESLLGGRKELAHDLAQESFLQLHRTAWGTLPADEVRFWLYRVARNMAINEFRKSNARYRLFDRVVETMRLRARNPEQDYDTQERKTLVLEMLQTLPEDQRAALLLREQEQLTFREISAVLNVSESKVKVDIFRARAALRKQWKSDVQRHEASSKQWKSNVQTILGEIGETTAESAAAVRELIQEEAVARDYVAMRYRTLIDQKYLRGLSTSEEHELEELKTTLDRMDKPYYASMIKRLRKVLESREGDASQIEYRQTDASLL
jgi:RNA polymerase sigma-70 factor (ECF subfamily)